jgi:ribosome recycling factor
MLRFARRWRARVSLNALEEPMEIAELTPRMQGAVAALKGELGGLRTGRASISLLEPLHVDAYGAAMPISQLATISVPEPRMLSVQVWDKSNVQAVDRAIREANLGLNPIMEGTLLRIPIPDLTAERRQELVKVAHKYAEQARVAVRHVRRDGLDQLKKEEKDGRIGQDEQHHLGEQIQKMTDETIGEIDRILAEKETEITQV